MSDARELKQGEPHPAVASAQEFLSSMSHPDWMRWMHTFKINQHDGDKQRIAQVCYLTMEKMQEELPVGDTEIIGLAWIIKYTSV